MGTTHLNEWQSELLTFDGKLSRLTHKMTMFLLVKQNVSLKGKLVSHRRPRENNKTENKDTNIPDTTTQQIH